MTTPHAGNLTLRNLFVSHDGRPMHKWWHYFHAYERHFGRFVGKPVTFVEVGCGGGGSLQMWKRWLGPHATIVGVDINAGAKAFEEQQIKVRIGDQSDPEFLSDLVAEFGSPDVLLDDGSHMMDDVAATFRHLYPKMAPEGVYMVEDMHTAYMPRYGGGLGQQNSFIEQAKSLIDELNAYHVPERSHQPSEFTDTTVSMHFYDSIIVFERGMIGERRSVRIRDGVPQTAKRAGGGAAIDKRASSRVSRPD